MLLGIILFSILLVVFVCLGTLLLCGKGYFIISGYRTLTEEQKKEFVSKNNLSNVFKLYAYYCYAVSAVLIVALVGALLNSMITISVSYILFGVITIATLIVVNVHSSFKVVSIDEKVELISKNTAGLEPKRVEVQPEIKIEKEETLSKPKVAKKTTKTATKPEVVEEKKTETKVEEKEEVKPVEEKKEVATKKPATKKTTAKKSTATSTAKKTTAKKPATKKTTTKKTTTKTTK